MILASTTAYPGIEDDLAQNSEYLRRAAAVDREIAEIFADRSTDQAEKTRLMAMAAAPMNLWDLGLLDAWRAVLRRVRFSGEWNPGWLAGRLRSPRPTDPEAVLRDLRRRTLILHGEQDLSFPVQVAHRLLAAVPHSGLSLVPEAGHAAHFERQADWVGRVRAFLTG